MCIVVEGSLKLRDHGRVRPWLYNCSRIHGIVRKRSDCQIGFVRKSFSQIVPHLIFLTHIVCFLRTAWAGEGLSRFTELLPCGTGSAGIPGNAHCQLQTFLSPPSTPSPPCQPPLQTPVCLCHAYAAHTAAVMNLH